MVCLCSDVAGEIWGSLVTVGSSGGEGGGGCVAPSNPSGRCFVLQSFKHIIRGGMWYVSRTENLPGTAGALARGVWRLRLTSAPNERGLWG